MTKCFSGKQLAPLPKSSWTVTANGQSGSHGPENLFDNNLNTYFLAKNSLEHNWIQINFGGVVEVNIHCVHLLDLHIYEMELYSEQNIERVDLFKRMSYQSFDEVKDIEVRVGNHNIGKYLQSSIRVNAPCPERLSRINDLPTMRYFCRPPLSGRFLTIQGMKSLLMALSEVEIYKSGKSMKGSRATWLSG